MAPALEHFSQSLIAHPMLDMWG